MFCRNCNNELGENSVVCVKCGVSLQKSSKSSSGKKNRPEGYEGFYTSTDEKMVLGVCGGLSHKFGLQLGLVRFLTFVSLFFVIGWLYIGGFFIPKLPTKGV